MVTAILILLAIFVGIPVAWQLIKLFFELIMALSGIIVAVIFVLLIFWIVSLIV